MHIHKYREQFENIFENIEGEEFVFFFFFFGVGCSL